MKGLIMAVGLLVMSMGISCGLMYYVSYENLRQDTVFALKQSLSETMVQLDDLDPSQRLDQALSLFIDNFKLRKKTLATYQIDLMGMIPNPLALRIRINVQTNSGLFHLGLSADETMIEVNDE